LKDKLVVVPNANTSKYGLKSFAHGGPQIWNSLPNELRKSKNYGEFRRLIRNWDSPVCKCSACRRGTPPYAPFVTAARGP
ncbi:hypothetical protein LSAT2_004450, partial [Lamellibrachia satsuma]